jgi:hypothetical protein
MIGAPEIEDADDVRVVESGEDPCFTVEALGELRVPRQLVGQQLERHQPVQMRLAGFEDESHAAPPKESESRFESFVVIVPRS